MFSNHADAVTLTQAANEVFLEPGELEAGPFDLEHFRHVAADHPTDVYAQLRFMVGAHAGLLPCRPIVPVARPFAATRLSPESVRCRASKLTNADGSAKPNGPHKC